jgi:hypothetical protein
VSEVQKRGIVIGHLKLEILGEFETSRFTQEENRNNPDDSEAGLRRSFLAESHRTGSGDFECAIPIESCPLRQSESGTPVFFTRIAQPYAA